MGIGDRIRKKRKEKKLTQTELSSLVNVSSQVISNWEREYTDLSHDDVARLAEILDCSTEYLLGRKPEENNSELKENDEKEFQEFLNDPNLGFWAKEFKEFPEAEKELRKIWEILKVREVGRKPGDKQ